MKKVSPKTSIKRNESENLGESTDDLTPVLSSPILTRVARDDKPGTLSSSGSLTNVFLADGSVLDAQVEHSKLRISAGASIGSTKPATEPQFTLLKKVAEPRGVVTRAMFAHNSNICWIAALEGTLCGYDCISLQFAHKIKVHHSGITDFDLTQSNELAVCALADGAVHLIDIVRKKRLQVLTTDSRCATAVRFEPTKNEYICVGDETGTLTVISLKQPQQPQFRLTHLAERTKIARVTAMCWSPRLLYVGDEVGRLMLFAFDETNRVIRLVRYGVFKSKITALQYSAKHNILAVNTRNSHIHVVDGTSIAVIRVFTRPQEEIDIGACWLPDGRTVISGSEDQKVYIFDCNSATLQDTLGGKHTLPVTSVDASTDGKLLCSVSDAELCVWSNSLAM